MLVRDVALPHVLAILEPIWIIKTETASRLRGRIESVPASATVKEYRPGDNPARWRGYLDKQLPQPSKVAKVEHHPAQPYDELGDFTASLRTHEGMSAQALEKRRRMMADWAAFCGTRSAKAGEVVPLYSRRELTA